MSSVSRELLLVSLESLLLFDGSLNYSFIHILYDTQPVNSHCHGTVVTDLSYYRYSSKSTKRYVLYMKYKY